MSEESGMTQKSKINKYEGLVERQHVLPGIKLGLDTCEASILHVAAPFYSF